MSDGFRISGRDEGMTLRERFRRTMQFQTVDRIPNFEFGYWDQTLPAWREQGMPDWVKTEADAYNYFGIENWGCAGPNLGLNPAFEGQILEETDEYIIGIDGERAKYQSQKAGIRTIPHYLEYGLKDRDDWKLFKERLQPGPEGRYPDNWDELAAEYNKRDYPLAVPVSSMIGTPRNWIGFQNIAYMCYDDPDLLDEDCGDDVRRRGDHTPAGAAGRGVRLWGRLGGHLLQQRADHLASALPPVRPPALPPYRGPAEEARRAPDLDRLRRESHAHRGHPP